jgi:hypothetical protein
MDNTAKLWDVETGKEIVTLKVSIIIFLGSSRRNYKSKFFI